MFGNNESFGVILDNLVVKLDSLLARAVIAHRYLPVWVLVILVHRYSGIFFHKGLHDIFRIFPGKLSEFKEYSNPIPFHPRRFGIMQVTNVMDLSN